MTNLPPSCADCLENWEPQSLTTLKACPHSQNFTFCNAELVCFEPGESVNRGIFQHCFFSVSATLEVDGAIAILLPNSI
jgi:hypothetical protein